MESSFVPPRTSPCARCGQPMQTAQSYIAPDGGGMICSACHYGADSDDRVARSSRQLAWSTLGVGAVSVMCNPFFIFSLIAVGNAIAALRLLLRAEVRTALGTSHGGMMACAVLGGLLGLVQPGMLVLRLLLAAAVSVAP